MVSGDGGGADDACCGCGKEEAGADGGADNPDSGVEPLSIAGVACIGWRDV